VRDLNDSDLNKIRTVERATANLPQTATGNLFTINGRVKIIDIIGEVTTVIQAQPTMMKLQSNGEDISDNCDIDADAVGTVYNITGTKIDNTQENVNGVLEGQTTPIVATDGIDLVTDASSTGQVKWTVRYEIIEKGSSVQVA